MNSSIHNIYDQIISSHSNSSEKFEQETQKLEKIKNTRFTYKMNKSILLIK